MTDWKVLDHIRTNCVYYLLHKPTNANFSKAQV